ncbi:hypothetical protein ACFQX6_01890 [Streptosporangium lutulentum]
MPAITTQAVLPVILGSAPLPYGSAEMGAAAVPLPLSLRVPRQSPPRLNRTVSPGRSSAALTLCRERQAVASEVPAAESLRLRSPRSRRCPPRPRCSPERPRRLPALPWWAPERRGTARPP